jgi:hypothetical protein
MELDNLKTIWKEQELLPGDDQEHAEMLAQLIRERSHGPIARMRRNLRFEGLLMLVTYIPTVMMYLFMFQGRLSGIGLMMTLILIFFLVYFYQKNRLLKKMQCVTCEVRSNLAQQVRVLGKYIRFYLWSGMVVKMAAFVIAYWVLEYSEMQAHKLQSPHWFKPVYLLVLLVPFAVGSYFLDRAYIHKLYGRHVKKLKELLREMDEV